MLAQETSCVGVFLKGTRRRRAGGGTCGWPCRGLPSPRARPVVLSGTRAPPSVGPRSAVRGLRRERVAELRERPVIELSGLEDHVGLQVRRAAEVEDDPAHIGGQWRSAARDEV